MRCARRQIGKKDTNRAEMFAFVVTIVCCTIYSKETARLLSLLGISIRFLNKLRFEVN